MLILLLWMGLAVASNAPNLVLISLDTTRADALSCYGQPIDTPRGKTPATPRIDALAAEGVRLERFWAHAPTTLSSHASMFTGLDPHGHGVVRNGFPLDPSHPTLAERLSEAGWDTIAVVGSKALERPMGLDRGFDVYDDTLSDKMGIMVQDRGDRVVDRTLARLDAREGDAPLFLFVHLYDPHMPYVAPAPYGERYVPRGYDGPWKDDPGHPVRELIQQIQDGTADVRHQRYLTGSYLGEVAWADAQVGRLLDDLEARGLLDPALVVVTADHGETLREFTPFAWSHGSEVGIGATRIPLVARGYGVALAQRAVVEQQAGLNGLARTLERALGLDPSLGTGHDFWDLLRPGPLLDAGGWPERPVRPVFVEATRPRQLERDEGWNNLPFFRGVWAGGWGAYRAPIYDMEATFYPPAFSAPPDPAVLELLDEMLDDWDAAAPPRREVQMAPTTRDALEQLGYIEADE